MCPSNVNRTTTTKPTSAPISLLQRLSSPQAIIHIGAGRGQGEMHQWRHWNVSQALIIDADEDRLDWAAPFAASKPGWQVLGITLAEEDGEVDFFQCTNPDEDGVIPPERLTALWPNLQATSQRPRSVQRLDHVLAQAHCAAIEKANPVWVFIDCLPALPILKGAGDRINQWSVVWIRVLLQTTAEIDDGALLEGIETLLHPRGFRCVDVRESNHPSIGYALFARDWQEVQQHRIDTVSQEVTALMQAQFEHKKLAMERLTRLEAVTQANAMLAQEKAVLIQLSEGMGQERDVYATRVKEQQIQLDELTMKHAALADEKSALAARCDALQGEVSKLTQSFREQSNLSAGRQARIDEIATTIAAMKIDVQKLESDAEEWSRLIREQDLTAAEKDYHIGQLEAAFAESERHLEAAEKKLTAISEEHAMALQEIDVAAKEREQRLAKFEAEFTESERRLKAEILRLEQVADENAKALQEIDVAAKEHEDHFVKLEAEFNESERRLKAEAQKLTRDMEERARVMLAKDIAARERESQFAKLSAEFAESDRRLKAEVKLVGQAAEENSRALQAKDLALREQEVRFVQREAEHSELERQLKAALKKLEMNLEASARALQEKEEASKAKEDHFAKLAAESTELERRQQDISEEMLRADAQIDFIKDILIRGDILTGAAGAIESVVLNGNQQKRLANERPRKRKT